MAVIIINIVINHHHYHQDYDDYSLRCDIVVFRRLFPSEQQLSLTKQICAPGIGGALPLVSSAAFFLNFSAAFDFRAVCIGCPEAGTPEAESARTVAQYVVSTEQPSSPQCP